MKKNDRDSLENRLDVAIESLKPALSMPGIEVHQNKIVFIKQLIDSIRRVQFVTTVRNRKISEECLFPDSIAFDPIKAASYYVQNRQIDEAFWLTFLAIHFGKHKTKGWQLVKSIYQGVNGNRFWSWNTVACDFDVFCQWLSENHMNFEGSFGNHRKYETLKPGGKRSPSNVFKTYLDWIGPERNHSIFIERNTQLIHEPKELFHHLYDSMGKVASFGRTARFDYLTMIGKLGLVEVEPGKAYLKGATGPRAGAQLLFMGNINSKLSVEILDSKINIFHEAVPLGYMGMQVLEDALCNWQKSPDNYILFRG